MLRITLVSIFTILIFSFGCEQPKQETLTTYPPAEGFDMKGSDEKAIAIADEVVLACGGIQNWYDSRYINWDFVTVRKHFWDKATGDIRIESKPDSITYLLNINTLKGRVQVKGQEITDPESLQIYLKKGKSLWINDSYWLVLPFKLKDSGVTLKHKGEKNTSENRPADALELTFKNVGDTPNNKYEVLVDKETRLITEWSYFKEASQDTAVFTMPWKNYQKYGNILLSSDHGRLQLTEISVVDSMPKETFSAF